MRRTSLLLVASLALLALIVAGCSEGTVEATPNTVVGEVPTEPTETGGGDIPALELTGDASAGAEVFTSAGCGSCHTLSAAGSSGTVGPNLDDAKPSYELAATRVTKGQGGMPSFEGQLEPQQIADVAQYVVESTSG
jgi:mono/diheme cytochrome c family protein